MASNSSSSAAVAGPVVAARWTPGKGHSAKWYYDEALPAFQLEKENPAHQSMFPHNNLDLSDACCNGIFT